MLSFSYACLIVNDKFHRVLIRHVYLLRDTDPPLLREPPEKPEDLLKLGVEVLLLNEELLLLL